MKKTKIGAYVLTGDPSWIEASIHSYYGIVDTIVVSYDKSRRGWTGAPIPVDECIERLRAVDPDRKMRLEGGDYARLAYSPMENDTFQRQAAMAALGVDVEWILAIDNDEIVGDSETLLDALRSDVPSTCDAVSWPLRTFFQVTCDGRLLEVMAGPWSRIAFEAVPVAIRPNVILNACRRTSAKLWRYGFPSRLLHSVADKLCRRCSTDIDKTVARDKALFHLSWVRTLDAILSKVRSWGHARDFDAERYVREVWAKSASNWKGLRNFHPLNAATWPRLRPVTLPASLFGPARKDLEALGISVGGR